ncbi:hypothetical protein BH10PSE10_BH10PSE10_13040 [soil metagenome]
MPVHPLNPRFPVVNFFAHDVTDGVGEAPRPANDNSCPYCGGVLEPGDKAEDCSSSGAWPMIPFPKGWGASC